MPWVVAVGADGLLEVEQDQHHPVAGGRLAERTAPDHRLGVIVALDSPKALKGLIAQNGHEPTLEDVFLELTGKQLAKEDQVG